MDLNPHQVDAALFAFRSPLSRGAILADEVGLGKTIEAGIIISQLWAEKKRRILVIVPASLRKQWSIEPADKFFIPSCILESKSFRELSRRIPSPFQQPNQVVICSYHFARAKAAEVTDVPWDLVVKHRTQHYYIRRYSSTVEAKGDGQRELLSLTATVPFDDRMCRAATIDDLSLPLIRSFLKDIDSGLYQQRSKLSLAELARLLNIVDGADERIVPRNVGLLFFCETPERFMPGTQIDVVIFPEGAGGDQIVEKILHGPIHQQIRDALRYIQNNVVVEKVIKHPDRAKATRFFNYPMAAIEEALVNALYHRGYDQREPVEVRVHPDVIEIVSYPGLDPSIRPADLKGTRINSRRYRNRRIGEFFKELEMTEGRGTGIPKIRAAMKRNGSPRTRFKADDLRLWFVVELPIHRAFAGEAAAATEQVTP